MTTPIGLETVTAPGFDTLTLKTKDAERMQEAWDDAWLHGDVTERRAEVWEMYSPLSFTAEQAQAIAEAAVTLAEAGVTL